MNIRLTFSLTAALLCGSGALANYADTNGYPSDEVITSPYFYDDLARAGENAATVEFLDLGMRHPKLTQVPAVVYTMPRLKYLSLAFNRVARVGDDIANLTELEELYLQGNHYLHTVSDKIGQLPNLRLVHIADTGLSAEKVARLRAILPKGCKLQTTH